MTIMEKKSRLGRAAAGLLAAALTLGMAGFAGTTAASAADAKYETYDFQLSGLPTHNDSVKTSALGIVAVNSDKDVPKAVLNDGTATKDAHTTETKYVGVKPGEYTVTYTATGDQQKTAQVGMYTGSATTDGIFHSNGRYSSFSLAVKGYESSTTVESKKVNLSPAGAYLTVLGGDKTGTIHLTSTTPSQPDPQPTTKSVSIIDEQGETLTAGTLTVGVELGLSAKVTNVDKDYFTWGLTQTDKVIEFVDNGANPKTDVRVKALKAGTAKVTLTGRTGTAAEGLSATLTITVKEKQETKPVDPLAKFNDKERAYLEASYWVLPSQTDTSKGFDGWSPTKTVYTKLTATDLKGLKNSVPNYSVQDADALFHYIGATGRDEGGAYYATYKNGKKVGLGADYDTQTVTYTGRESGATITYVFTMLDKVVLPGSNTPNKGGETDTTKKPAADTTAKKPAPAATTTNANAVKSNGLAKTGADVTTGVVAMLVLLGAGAALTLRKRA
ncbi:hypothetical protein KIH77_03120 [Bifidobacterium sp. 82T24]|uniref:hypothetical protein n=1 Tax=Bifidobacterium pluvialisilvae TaxID=2834436 RepID=UPI001C57631F|nr:hypothetical protein [Bifidobacterium pluvialisilvae]MBW3087727.1 hypothetical protein [Bifidobacterium pluvialisilvae]